MGIIVKNTTFADGTVPTAASLNSDFDTVYTEFNGNIQNSNVKAGADIAESKVDFDTTNGHVHNGTDSKIIQVNRAFTWYLDGTSIDGVMGATYIAPQDMTVIKIYGLLTSGTCVATIKKGATTIDAISCSNALATEATITSAAITAGDVITLTLSSSSVPVNLKITMECTSP